MSEWTDERVETIKTLWLEGWSGAQIAKHLGDVSRSAVMAKLDRAGVLGVKRKAGVLTIVNRYRQAADLPPINMTQLL